MKDKIAEKILKMEKDKLMSKPESDRDWELITALDLAIKALEREADLEQAVVNIKMSGEEIKQFKQMLQEHTPLYTITSDTFVEGASVNRPQGEWIKHIDNLYPEDSTEECPFCHEEQRLVGNDDNFCPNCGAKMTKEAEND